MIAAQRQTDQPQVTAPLKHRKRSPDDFNTIEQLFVGGGTPRPHAAVDVCAIAGQSVDRLAITDR